MVPKRLYQLQIIIIKAQVYKLESTSDIIETWNESPCKSCSNYLQAKASGTPLICNCILGLSEIR